VPDDLRGRVERKQPLEVGILLFPEVEVRDFAFEVVSAAAIHSPFKVSLVSASGAPAPARPMRSPTVQRAHRCHALVQMPLHPRIR